MSFYSYQIEALGYTVIWKWRIRVFVIQKIFAASTSTLIWSGMRLYLEPQMTLVLIEKALVLEGFSAQK